MKTHHVICGFFILILIFFSGCNENSGNVNNIDTFIGAWEGVSIYQNTSVNITLTFYKDKTAKQISEGFHAHWFYFEIDNSLLCLTLQDFPEAGAICYNYDFSNNNNKLNLTNESIDTMILTKNN